MLKCLLEFPNCYSVNKELRRAFMKPDCKQSTCEAHGWKWCLLQKTLNSSYPSFQVYTYIILQKISKLNMWIESLCLQYVQRNMNNATHETFYMTYSLSIDYVIVNAVLPISIIKFWIFWSLFYPMEYEMFDSRIHKINKTTYRRVACYFSNWEISVIEYH